MASSDDKVRVNMTSGERTVPLQPAVRHVLEKLRAGDLPEPNRRALLDALGHDDCVPREHRGCHWEHEAQRYAGNADYWRDRLRADNRQWHKIWREALGERNAAEFERDKLCKAVQQHREEMRGIARQGAGGWTRHINIANQRLWAALSADADADAEPDQRSGVCGCGHVASKHAQGWKGCSVCACVEYADADAEPEPRDAELRDRAEQVVAGGADFCTAWNDEFGLCDRPPDHPGAHERVTGLGATVTWRDAEPSRAEGPDCTCNSREVDGRTGEQVHSTYCDITYAAGGRPREADPQGPSIGTGDASVDGGGDDGRSRAIEEVERLLVDNGPTTTAEDAIEAALASGGVVTAEQQTATGVELARERAQRQESEARVRELEAAIGEERVERSRYQGRASELEAKLRDVLGHLTLEGHPGRPCLGSGWIPVETVRGWWATLEGDSDA